VTSASEIGSDDDDDESDSDPQIDKPGGAADEVSGEQQDTVKKGKVDDERKPRKLVEDEARAVGKVSLDVWKLYLGLMGGAFFWIAFVLTFGGAKLSDVCVAPSPAPAHRPEVTQLTPSVRCSQRADVVARQMVWLVCVPLSAEQLASSS